MKNKFFKHLCVYLCAVMVLLSCVCFPSLGASAYGYVYVPLESVTPVDDITLPDIIYSVNSSLEVFSGSGTLISNNISKFTFSICPLGVFDFEPFVGAYWDYSIAGTTDISLLTCVQADFYLTGYDEFVTYVFSSVDLLNYFINGLDEVFGDSLEVDRVQLSYYAPTDTDLTLRYFDNEIDGLYPSIEYMLNYYIFGSEHVPTPEQTLVVTFLSVIFVLAVIVLPFAIVWFILAKLFSWW